MSECDPCDPCDQYVMNPKYQPYGVKGLIHYTGKTVEEVPTANKLKNYFKSVFTEKTRNVPKLTKLFDGKEQIMYVTPHCHYVDVGFNMVQQFTKFWYWSSGRSIYLLPFSSLEFVADS